MVNKFLDKSGVGYYDVRDKNQNIRRHIFHRLIMSLGMFEWEGLPNTIPPHILELYLQVNGFAGITRHKGELYCMFGGLGGEPDYNYEPTLLTVANPALNYSANLKIGEDVAIIKNDDLYMGLMPMYRHYATQLTENEISMYIATINSRIFSIISAGDTNTIASAERFIQKVTDGDLSVIAENQFFDGVKVQPYSGAGIQNSTKNLIEVEQYLKASWFNDMGLDANYNMKRETLTDSENMMNQNALYPFVDRLLYNRKKGAAEVNKLFGTNITVDLTGEWERMREEKEENKENLENEGNVEAVENNEQDDGEESENERLKD